MDNDSISRRRSLFTIGVLSAGSLHGLWGRTLLGCESALKRKEKEVAWLGEVQRRPAGIDAVTKGDVKLDDLLVGGDGKRITDVKGWEKRRGELAKKWGEYLGLLPVNKRRAVLKVLEEDVVKGEPHDVLRQLVEYEGEPEVRVRGYLLRPAKMKESGAGVAGVLVLHSTVNHTIRQPAGVEGAAEKAFGLALARMGMVAFCPECFLWVDKGKGSYVGQVEKFWKRHPKSTGMAKMLFDASRGLDVLANVKGVDVNRLGAIGHSLGGKEVLYLAAFDERVKVAVSSEGGIGTTFSNWDAPWYLGQGMKRFGREHHELLGMIGPRAFLLVGGDSADGKRSWPFIEQAMGVYDLYGKPARVGLLNHGKGHAVPADALEKMLEWLRVYL